LTKGHKTVVVVVVVVVVIVLDLYNLSTAIFSKFKCSQLSVLEKIVCSWRSPGILGSNGVGTLR